MDNDGAVVSLDFYASKNCPLARTRRNNVIFGVIGAAIAIIPLSESVAMVGLALAGVALVFFLVDYCIRRQLRPGKPVVTLSDEHLSSPNLSRKIKQLAWKDIESFELASLQNKQFIEFQLGESAAASFWSRLTGSTAKLPLATFSAEDQEKLFNEILDRHARSCAQDQATQPEVPPNALRAERGFDDKPKTLRAHAWITYGLIATNLLIWGLTLAEVVVTT